MRGAAWVVVESSTPGASIHVTNSTQNEAGVSMGHQKRQGSRATGAVGRESEKARGNTSLQHRTSRCKQWGACGRARHAAACGINKMFHPAQMFHPAALPGMSGYQAGAASRTARLVPGHRQLAGGRGLAAQQATWPHKTTPLAVPMAGDASRVRPSQTKPHARPMARGASRHAHGMQHDAVLRVHAILCLVKDDRGGYKGLGCKGGQAAAESARRTMERGGGAM